MKQIFAYPHQMETTNFGWPRNFLQWDTNNELIKSYQPTYPIIEEKSIPLSGSDFSYKYISLPETVINNQEILFKYNLNENDKPILKTNLTSFTVTQDTFSQCKHTEISVDGGIRHMYKSYYNDGSSNVGTSVAMLYGVTDDQAGRWAFNFVIDTVQSFNGEHIAHFPSTGYYASITSTNNILNQLVWSGTTFPTNRWLFGIGMQANNWYRENKSLDSKAFYLISPVGTSSQYSLPEEFSISIYSDRSSYLKPILIVSGAWLMTTAGLTVWDYKYVRSGAYNFTNTDSYYNTGMSNKVWTQILA